MKPSTMIKTAMILPRWRRWPVLIVLAAGAHLLAIACRSPVPVAPPPLADRTAASGLDFVHFNGMSGAFYFHEIAGSGGALFDYDNDGDLDVYLVQGHMLGGIQDPSEAVFPPARLPTVDRLFRNDLGADANGAPEPRFTDVTEASGILAAGYGMGVAAGDFDNDGWVDLFVTNFGANQLWRNRGDGTFEDRTAATAATGDGAARWSTSAAVVDLDRDGWLDLYVTNYVDYGPAVRKPCLTASGALEYCGPHSYQPEHDQLLRNRGDGTFEDISLAAGILDERGSGLGVVAADFDRDGWTDLYVANDLMRNVLWHSQGTGDDGRLTFRNDALFAGCAVDLQGRAQASMGVDAGDFDNDGDDDLFMTHLDGENNTVYRNQGQGLFVDDSAATALATPSLASTGFGTALFDLDNDGWLDIVVANGAVKTPPSLHGHPYSLHQPNQLFHNRGDGTFEEWSDRVPALVTPEVSRGVATGDLDNDGDLDVLLVNNNGPARLLINTVGQDAHWLGLRLLGSDRRRDQLGAEVVVRNAAGKPRLRRSKTDASYCSSNDPRVILGLGSTDTAEVDVDVRWPDGRREHFPALAIDRYHVLAEGSGQRPPPSEP